MDYGSYLASKDLLAAWGRPLTVSLLFLSALLLASLAIRPLRRHYKRIVAAIFFLLLAGFAFLAWYHLKIYNFIALINPMNGELVGRYRVPLWIEGEKLYFWTLFLALFSFVLNLRFKRPDFLLWLNTLLAGFVLVTAFYSNPFLNPLPQFNSEISDLYFMAQGAPLPLQIQLTQQAFMRMQFYYNSAYMWIHPPLLFISYAALTVSFLAFVFMLIRQREAIFDTVSYNYTKFGYLLLTVGILIGYPWAIAAWKNEPWWWSPKINMSLTMWVLYTAYLHSHIYLYRKGMWNTTALLGILCFSTLIFTYITTYLVPGVHSYR